MAKPGRLGQKPHHPQTRCGVGPRQSASIAVAGGWD